jgi:hypothetical protein
MLSYSSIEAATVGTDLETGIGVHVRYHPDSG